jgi:hypothetical protein
MNVLLVTRILMSLQRKPDVCVLKGFFYVIILVFSVMKLVINALKLFVVVVKICMPRLILVRLMEVVDVWMGTIWEVRDVISAMLLVGLAMRLTVFRVFHPKLRFLGKFVNVLLGIIIILKLNVYLVISAAPNVTEVLALLVLMIWRK